MALTDSDRTAMTAAGVTAFRAREARDPHACPALARTLEWDTTGVTGQELAAAWCGGYDGAAAHAADTWTVAVDGRLAGPGTTYRAAVRHAAAARRGQPGATVTVLSVGQVLALGGRLSG